MGFGSYDESEQENQEYDADYDDSDGVSAEENAHDGDVEFEFTASNGELLDRLRRLNRPDVRYLLLSGIAPAWFNLLDLRRLHDATALPTLSVSFEESPGLADTIRREFDGPACRRRLATYYAQPDRRRVAVGEDSCWVRAVGCEDPAGVVRAFTPEGGRPEPLRVARLAARAADRSPGDRSR